MKTKTVILSVLGVATITGYWVITAKSHGGDFTDVVKFKDLVIGNAAEMPGNTWDNLVDPVVWRDLSDPISWFIWANQMSKVALALAFAVKAARSTLRSVLFVGPILAAMLSYFDPLSYDRKGGALVYGIIFMFFITGWLAFLKKRSESSNEEEPSITLTPSNAVICPNEDVMVTAEVIPSDAAINWTANGGSSTSGTGLQFSTRFAQAGNYQIIAKVTAPSGREADGIASLVVRRASGPSWANDFPGSKKTSDLEQPFRGNLERFLKAANTAVNTAGVHPEVNVLATYRSTERAYLMHVSYCITRPTGNPYRMDPRSTPHNSNVDICWEHRDADGAYDEAASRAAAESLRVALGVANDLEVPPALNSRHTVRLGADVAIKWIDDLTMQSAADLPIIITSTPRTSANADLIAVAQSYGVIHFVNVNKDKNHWSDNGS